MLRFAGTISVYSAVLLLMSSTLEPCGATEPSEANWATPFIWSHDSATEIVTAGTGAVFSDDLRGNLLWSLKGMSSIKMATPYAADGRLFVLYDLGLESCFNAKTGEPFFQAERLNRGSEFTASPWSDDGKWFCLNEDGVCSLIKAGDTLEVLHTNSLKKDDLTLSTPAIAGDRLLIRTDKRVYCIPNTPAR